MKKAYNLLILTLILLSGAWSQEVDDLKTYGFINIATDSLDAVSYTHLTLPTKRIV